ncbi:hypothetical protein FH610_027020, partial [Microbispora catharanthi]
MYDATPPVTAQTAAPRTTTQTTTAGPARYAWAAARIAIGWVFLWAFLDKLFGWGFATPTAKAW